MLNHQSIQKLNLKRILEIQDVKGADLTSKSQHCFKHGGSTSTLSLNSNPSFGDP
jgi:hypothetical protein